MPAVSVIMNCYNGEKYLREAIDSIYAQTYTDWEIVFWDDASSDGSAEIAKSYDSRLRYFKGKKAISLGQARNWALEKAEGEFIAFLDQDDLWMPDKLEMQIPLFQADDEIGIVIADEYLFNDNEAIVSQMYLKKKPPTGYVFRELLKSYFISLGTATIRRRALEHLTYWFDERFTMIEESDLFIRIAYTWKLVYVDKPLGKWRMHKDSWTFSNPLSLPHERKMMLDTYTQIFEDFNTNYANEIKYLKATIDVSLAKIDLQQGRNREARVKLSSHIKCGYKFMFLYLLCFFPSRIYGIIKKWRGERPT
jgi:glycosyltransferase involved in cell wall biosynthesis